MTTLRHTTYRICTALLFCLLQMAGIVLYGQDDPRAFLKRAHRLPPADTVAVLQHRVADADTIPLLHRLPAASAADSVATADSIAASNRQTMLEMTSAPDIREEPVPADSLQNAVDVKRWVPNPTKATWLALVIPGGGQIYNRKFWKLPIFYGGFAGCAYALTWNSKMYNDYADAYRDAVNGNWNSSSITDLLPPGYTGNINKSVYPQLVMDYSTSFRRTDDDYYRIGWLKNAPNPNLRWEKTRDMKVSLDIGFLDDRLTLQLQATDLFNSTQAPLTLYSGNRLMTVDQESRRRIRFTLRYKFNAAKSKYKGTGAGQEQRSRM